MLDIVEVFQKDYRFLSVLVGWMVGGGRGKLQQVAKPPNLWISIFAFCKLWNPRKNIQILKHDAI